MLGRFDPCPLPYALYVKSLKYLNRFGTNVPPYKKASDYDEKSISGLPKKEYLQFLEAFFALLKQNAKKTTRLAFINADWRDFQNKPAAENSL